MAQWSHAPCSCAHREVAGARLKRDRPWSGSWVRSGSRPRSSDDRRSSRPSRGSSSGCPARPGEHRHSVGEAGIGKTSHVGEAASSGPATEAPRILRSAPAESEREPDPGRADRPAGRGLLRRPADTLPAVQRHALEIAVLRAEPTGQLPDQRTLSVATATLLRQLARDGPLIIAIDDLQWLDDATVIDPGLCRPAARGPADRPSCWRGRGYASAARRLTLVDAVPAGTTGPPANSGRCHSPHCTSCSWRGSAARSRGSPSSGSRRPRAATRSTRSRSPGAGRRRIRASRAGRAAADPGTLGAPGRGAYRRLPAATRSALVLVAVAAEPTVEALGRAEPGARAALGPACDAGVATLDRASVRFTHPLLGQAVIAGRSRPSSGAAHARSRARRATEEVRARHLGRRNRGPESERRGGARGGRGHGTRRAARRSTRRP